MAGLNPQITNLVIMLGMMQVSKRIPFDDPNVLNTVRAVYLGSNVLIALLYLYIGSQINKKKDLGVDFWHCLWLSVIGKTSGNMAYAE
ncbi:phosphate transporter (Pho88) [Metarhizium acridum CQMa 102]|uniref:Phosphate transporter (Pho88) n=1 Tax=Metarhizium acridum (strain CQMa 102) TaxID=655827 RepID=E9DYS1_METAQ|nr:phosphate transporter (Pho88) [Metarhizium acridum CQMa 102]EFY91098.1 phosphate transporter (Pho88) [Metarhizium acridum CQMa 102]